MTDPDLLDDVRNAILEAYNSTMDMNGPNFTVMAEDAIDAVLTYDKPAFVTRAPSITEQSTETRETK